MTHCALCKDGGHTVVILGKNDVLPDLQAEFHMASSGARSRPQTDLVSYYWNAYFQWRRIGGFDEFALRNILRSIRDDLAAQAVIGDHAVRLKKLANMLDTELRIAAETEREAR